MKVLFTFLLSLLLTTLITPQETDIVQYLKQIESGDKEAVKKKLIELKKKTPSDPSVIFLDGVLTEEAEKGVLLFEQVLTKYPKSRYADASAYRLSSYYYSLRDYTKFNTYVDRLKKDYPASPYIKLAEKKYPAFENEDTKLLPVVDPLPPGKKNANIVYKFMIQAGAFSNKENADALKQDFIASGYPSEIKEKNVAGTVFHVVFVGKYASEEEAKNFLEVINNQFKLDGRVVPITGH